MSICEEIVAKLESIDDNMRVLATETVDMVNGLVEKTDNNLLAISELTGLVADSIENQKIIAGALKTISENQVNDNKILKIITDGIGKSAKISLANNEYLKNLQQTNGAIPRDVLIQISNIEAVAKVLNKVYLGG